MDNEQTTTNHGTALDGPPTPQKRNSELLASQAAAGFLGVTTATLRRYVKAGKLPAVRWSKTKVYYRKADLIEFAMSGSVAPRKGGTQ